jgi:hypothetical protein
MTRKRLKNGGEAYAAGNFTLLTSRSTSVCSRVCEIAKSGYQLRHVCPCETARLPLDGF